MTTTKRYTRFIFLTHMLNLTQPADHWWITKPALEKSLAWQYGILAIMSALAVLTLLYAVRQARRTGRSDPIWICLGAALAVFYEPLGDFFAHVTYHEVNQINLTSAFGFHTPLWVLPTYVVFFGAPILLLLPQLERGISMVRWMAIFVLSMPGAFLFEVPLLQMGSIAYYGENQPFQILGYPLWMAFANGCTMLVVTTAVHFLRQSAVIQQHPFFLAPVLPMLVMGANGGAALPLASAINGSASVEVVNLMALLSMGLATLYVWLCGKLAQPRTAALST